MTENMVEFISVNKAFGATKAVDDFCLKVKNGQFVTLLGASGSGKTTTLMMLAGFLAPDSGTITIGGKDVTYVPPHRRDIGLVYQHYALFPHMTVAKNIAFPLEMRGIARNEILQRVGEALRAVRLEGLEERRPLQLSGGQQQRVALARALVFAPSILLMDEPLGALDKNLREEMQLEILRIHRQFRITTIYVTHDQQEAMSMSDLIVVMRDGRIEQVAEPRILYSQPKNAFVATFIGSANVLNGMVRRTAGQVLFITDAGTKVPFQAKKWEDGTRARMIVRPERVSIAEGEQARGGLPGTVDGVVFGGSSVKYIVKLIGDEALEVVQMNVGAAEFSVGDRVVLDWSEQDVLLVPVDGPFQ